MPVKTEWISKTAFQVEANTLCFGDTEGNPTKIKSFRGDAAERGRVGVRRGAKGWRGGVNLDGMAVGLAAKVRMG